MAFGGFVLSTDTDNDTLWLRERSAKPEYDDFKKCNFNDQRDSITGKSYGTNAAQNFSEHELSQDPRSHSFWGRSYGPPGPTNLQSFPLENDNESFLLQCGVQKSTLKRLPKVLVRLMEPEYCGVCAIGFDRFAGAGLHYMTRNHDKNLKKWLAQQAKVGSKRPKEIALRARTLYCELCDINLTSIAHADSHYAGKPHRAIVEGRRVPKNPFLLQEHMNHRVEQLIRREKKCLKPMETPAATAIVNAINVPIPPELYCNICKTSVSSTDQMAMHLNGKKHLTKEKHHIFKIMEIGRTKPKCETAATAKDADAETTDDVWEEWDTKDHKDDLDWGDGSGTWDDDPQ